MERIKSGILSGDIFESVKKSPVSDAYIYIKPIRVSSLISSGQVNGDAYSSKEGKFSIHDLRVGLYKVYCKAPGFPEIYKKYKNTFRAVDPYLDQFGCDSMEDHGESRGPGKKTCEGGQDHSG